MTDRRSATVRQADDSMMPTKPAVANAGVADFADDIMRNHESCVPLLNASHDGQP